MTRRRALWLLALGSLVLFAVLAAIDQRMWDEGGPGIVGFELARTAHHARDILDEWGPDGRAAARASLWVDFAYLAAYGAFWALAVAALRDAAGRRGWGRLARAGRLAVFAPLGAAAFDALEDVNLLLAVGRHGLSVAAPLAASFAVLKFVLLGVTIAYAAVVLVRLAFARRPRVTAAVGLAAALSLVAFLAVNAVVVSRVTSPAKPDVGRLVHVRGHDIQVREDGPRGGPPLVLIHGFGCSLHWWDLVTPALARENRVIRVDLLGHGGSEKPRDGYSMEEQADLVAAVMRKLGVRRAAVVGHSMGGIVATALVERHRAMVSRLMMIGTAPDAVQERWGRVANLAFWPVTGQATDTLIRRETVRQVVEAGFAPEFDPPERLARDIFERTTFNSFTKSGHAAQDFWDERSLDRRLAGKGVPVTVLLGEEEQHTRRSIGIYNAMGARTVVMQGLDHSPQVEAPDRTARLIAAFARD